MIAGGSTFYRIARFTAGFFFLIAGLAGCAAIAPQTDALRQSLPAGLPERIELGDVPFYPQKDYQCGPAALATTLANIGVKVTPEDLVAQVYLPARQGSLQVEMIAAARRYGMVSYQLAPRFKDLLREVAAGNPVIVLQNYGVWPIPVWHYAVVVGYDYQKGELLLRSGEKPRLEIPFGILEYTWKESGYWAMVVIPPGHIPVTANESDYLLAVAAIEHAGSPRAAKQAYTTFLARWPNNLGAAIGLSNVLYAMGELREAELALRRAVIIHPDSVAVLNNLAQTLSDQGRNDEAMELIERASALGGVLAPAVQETKQLILLRVAENNARQSSLKERSNSKNRSNPKKR